MTIKIGDRLPQADFIVMTADGQQKMSTDVIFAGRKVVLFGVPGAFTPTCPVISRISMRSRPRAWTPSPAPLSTMCM
jgi:peroxiredoxin